MTTVTHPFHAVRQEEYPWAARETYLNHASIGPLPARTLRAVNAFNERRHQPSRLKDGDLFGGLRRAREVAAKLIGADPAEIALCPNTTVGVNMAAGGLSLAAGDTVLVSDKEFPANVYPWLRLRERGVSVEMLPTTADGWPDEARLLERVERGDVRVLAVSHVQFATGYRVDLDALSAACRRQGTYLVVDAIQALGAVPLDVRRTPVDIIACGGQKWLLSPWGSGFLYVRRQLIERIQPPIVSWMSFQGTDDLNRLTEYSDALRDDARRYEMVTIPFQDFAGFSASVELLLELGIDRIAEHLARLQEPLVEAAEAGVFTLGSPSDPAHASAIATIRVEDAAEAYRRLGEEGVTCSMREGAIRLSPHFYNTREEMARVVELLAAERV